jgi:hypothetical protein
MILHIRSAFAPILHKIVHTDVGYASRAGRAGVVGFWPFYAFLRLYGKIFFIFLFFSQIVVVYRRFYRRFFRTIYTRFG